MRTQIYIVTHKKNSFYKPNGNYSLFVGSSGKDGIGEDFRDDMGKNISEKNPNYCELTGLYWIWKNSNAEIVGLCHYRRYLSLSKISNNPKFFLDGKMAEKILETHDVILPQQIVFEKSVRNKINYAPNINDMKELRMAIKKTYPEYLEDYEWYMNQNKTYWYNIMVCRKEILNEYCEWLFKVLNMFDQIHDMSIEEGYRLRLQGMLSERLLNIWIHHNIKETKIKELRWIQTDKPNDCVKRKMKYFVKQFIWNATKRG